MTRAPSAWKFPVSPSMIETLENRTLMSGSIASPAVPWASHAPAVVVDQVPAVPATDTSNPEPTDFSVTPQAVAPALPALATATPTHALGGNLQDQSDYGMDHALSDLVKSGTFRALSGTLTKDANGWPLQDFSVSLWIASKVDPGRYNASFTGPANAVLSSSLGGTAKFTKVSYNAATKLSTWTIDVPAGSSSLGVQVTNTGGQVKNLRVLQPGVDPANPSIWAPKYIKMLKSQMPDTLRAQEIVKMNKGNLTANWADRPKPTDASFAKAGVPWEYLIQLCNQVGSNLWACIPAHATDDYIRQFATLVKGTLNANLKIYLEYSNEVWNLAYEQGKYNYAQAQAEVAKGGSNLKYDGTTNATSWADRRTARRHKEIGDIFKSVWTSAGLPSPINGRVRVVLGGQGPLLSRFDNMLTYINKNYGAPKNYFYGIGIAPYFTMNKYNDDVIIANKTPGGTTLTKDQILEGMSLSVSAYETEKRFAKALTYGSKWGLKLELYEGGNDTHGSLNVQAKKAASLDPKIAPIIQRYLAAFWAQGGDLINWYTYGARTYDGIYGTWTISNDLNNLNQPKEQALRAARGLPALV